MKTVPRILIIDDEKSIRNTLILHFKNQQYEFAEADTGAEGIQKANHFHPHLIILDLGLPDMNGYEVLKSLRQWTQVPIIILTVNDEETTKVKLLDSGADDYLTKPFGAAELLARVRVCLRNHGLVEATPIFESGNLKIDLNQKIISVDQQIVKLTKTEFELISRLVRENGKVISQSQLLKQIWGVTAKDESHYLRIYINQLRKKIEKNPADPIHIITEPGVGYRLV